MNRILYYEMPCISVSKLSQKQKVVPKCEYVHFKLIFVRSKIMYLRICGSFKSAIIGPINRKSANSKKIYGPQIANLKIVTFAEGPQITKILSAYLRICDLRNLFEDRPPLMIIQGQAFLRSSDSKIALMGL